jgi:DNA-binding Lrp family transcriptional regulator
VEFARAKLNLKEAATWRSLKMLWDSGILHPSLMITRPRGKKGGRRVKLFQTIEASPEQIKEALELQSRLESPKYMQAVLVAQAMLTDFPMLRAKGEVSYSEILDEVRSKRLGLSVPDVAHLVSQYLSNEGVTVWR